MAFAPASARTAVAQVERDGEVVADAQQVAPGRFGVVTGDHTRPIPAPPLPHVRLRERG